MMDKKDAPIVALPEQEIFHVSYTHDDYNGHYVNGGKFDVSKEQLIRFLDILKKYINNRQIEDDDEIYISGIKEWQDFFFHPFGFVGYASSYEIRIHSAGGKFYLTGEDLETIDKIRLSLRDNG